MSHVVLQGAFEEAVDPESAVVPIGTGFTFTEGPIWHPIDHHLLFSDMPADVRRRWDEQGGVREVMRPSNKCNGMTYDHDLNLIVCEHATSSLVRERPDGRRDVLASHFEGRELNSPNDVCVKSDGAIYFSDPWYGRMPGFGVERPRQLGFQGVYRLPPGGGSSELMVDRFMFDQPNGVCFSPDETLFYVNDTVQALIRVFDVDPRGALANGRVFASGIVSEHEAGRPDGMKCDALGNIWVTAPGGLWVYAASGERIGKIQVPEMAANLTWGDPDFKTLYICATQSVFALRTRVGPRLEPYMRAQVASASVHAGGGATASASRPAPAFPSPDPASLAQPAPLSPALDRLDPARCALIIQDMQNDVISEGGAFAASGSPAHCRQQNAIANAQRLAEACRKRGVMVIHVWFVVEPGAPGLTLNAPLFTGLVEANAMVRGTWGAAPVAGLEPQPGDHVVEKMRMSAWEGTRLETVLKSGRRDTIIVTGAWTNMSIEHTARTGADKGYRMIVPEDCCATMNADWHRAAIDYALQNVSIVTNADAVIAAFE